ncbi:hypothetical protein SAMN05421766_10611 [Zobellia uliginosa]|uniref:Uncharacterized protein n=2 Tax=Zobellia uliginosa TaxID=143224 RepID=A0ABY1L2X2_9FLAO|nr:hypothetical protein SAMN05421766_10611 [Zobellia uliginosa]
MDKATNMSAEEWGDFTGQVAFEILMEIGTAESAAALTAAKVADRTVDAARVLDKLDDLGDAAKAADKLEDISDGTKLPKVPEELGPVLNKVDDMSPGSPGHKAWIQGGIDRGAAFKLTSPRIADNLWDAKRGAPTVFADELAQLKKAGYIEKDGHMVPKNNIKCG